MVVIYKITSPIEKVYIGQTRHLIKRKSHYKKLKCIKQPLIYNSLLKYGWDQHKFEIIHELPDSISQEDLNNYETFYINKYKNLGFKMMNIKEGGSFGLHSESSKEKIRLKKLGIKQSKETINKRLDTFKNNNYKPTPPSNLGKKTSEKTKIKQSLSHLGKTNSNEHKEKCRLNARTSVILLDLNTGVYYNNITELSNLYNIPRSNLIRFFRKKMKDNAKSKTVPDSFNNIKIV